MIVIVNMCGRRKERYCIVHLVNTFKKYNVPFILVDSIDQVLHKPQGIIISGSPIRFTRRIGQSSMKRILVAVHLHLTFPDVPILGICFGFQLLNLLYGGSIKPFGRLVCEKHDDLEYCFNDYIDKVGDGFRKTKHVTVDGRKITCVVSCPKRHITGYLFHSEATDLDRNGWIRKWIKASYEFRRATNIP